MIHRLVVNGIIRRDFQLSVISLSAAEWALSEPLSMAVLRVLSLKRGIIVLRSSSKEVAELAIPPFFCLLLLTVWIAAEWVDIAISSILVNLSTQSKTMILILDLSDERSMMIWSCVRVAAIRNLLKTFGGHLGGRVVNYRVALVILMSLVGWLVIIGVESWFLLQI